MMQVGRGGDDDGVDVRVVDDLPVVVRGQLDPVAVGHLLRPLDPAGADRDDLRFLDLPEHRDMHRRADARADDGDLANEGNPCRDTYTSVPNSRERTL